MDNETFQQKAIRLVEDYIERSRDKSDEPTAHDTFVMWFVKTLQNWKALVSTTLPDGRYYEVTYNGDKHEAYLDVYVKIHNESHAD